MKKSITLFVCFAAMAIGLQLNAKSIYLSSTGDDANTGISSDNAVASLNVACQLAGDNDVILVSGMIAHSGLVTIGKSVTIRGADENAGFDGQNVGNFFVWNGAGQLNVEQLVFRMGSGVDGGAISCVATGDNAAGSVTFRKCGFYENMASGRGGAIFADGCNVGIIRCNFEGNSASSHGGAIYIRSGRVVANYVVTQSLFKNNVTSGDAGALYCSSDGFDVHLNFYNSTCYRNSASRGGAFCFQNNTALINASLTNLTLFENITTGNIDAAGGIRINGVANVTLNNCLIYDNFYSGGALPDRTNKSDIGGNSSATGLTFNSSIISHIRPTQVARTPLNSTNVYNDLSKIVVLYDVNTEGVVTFASDALPVNFANPALLTAVGEAVDQRDMKRLTEDGMIDCGAFEYGATEVNNSFPTAINKPSVESDLVIYPNPVNAGMATLQISNETEAVIDLYALSGVRVASLIGCGMVQLPCDFLKPGVYLVVVKQGDHERVKRLVIR